MSAEEKRFEEVLRDRVVLLGRCLEVADALEGAGLVPEAVQRLRLELPSGDSPREVMGGPYFALRKRSHGVRPAPQPPVQAAPTGVAREQRTLIVERILARHAEWIGSQPHGSMPPASSELDRQCLLALLASTDAELRRALDEASGLEADLSAELESTPAEISRLRTEVEQWVAEAAERSGEVTRLEEALAKAQSEVFHLKRRIAEDNPSCGDTDEDVFP